MNVVPEGRAKQKSNKFPSIWYQPTVFVFSPNPTKDTYKNTFYRQGLFGISIRIMIGQWLIFDWEQTHVNDTSTATISRSNDIGLQNYKTLANPSSRTC